MTKTSTAQLYPMINTRILNDRNHRSRVHKISLNSGQNSQSWLKRDDELSFGISGSKLRKYLSLLPFLQKSETKIALVVGGANSHNVVGLCQLLIEAQIHFRLYLRGPKSDTPFINQKIIQLLSGEQNICWIQRSDWHRVKEIADLDAEAYARQGLKPILIPEGAFMNESLFGALTLPLDIARNEDEHKVKFNHVFVDSGTGLTAFALMLGASILKASYHIHVLLLAEDEEAFWQRNMPLKDFFEANTHTKVELLPASFFKPVQGKSFGTVTRTQIEELRKVMRQTGVLFDPIYSGKLIIESKRLVEELSLQGNCLIIHSGGAISLLDFLDHPQSDCCR